MEKSDQEISKLSQIFFRPKEEISPSDWIEKHIRLNHRQSVHAGMYSFSRTPYLKQIADDCANPNIRQISIMKSAQCGVSQLISNIIFYYVCNRTLPIAIILPSQALAQQFSERNIHNCLDTCEPLQDFITDRLDDIKRTDLSFRSCNLKIIGGGSATKLSSNPIALVCIDECDKLESFLREATPIELAIDRTLSFKETKQDKVILSSTPTLHKSSEIEKHFLEGSQSKYHVPCPHCKFHQELVMENIKWSENCKEDGEWNLKKVEDTAYYQCANCGKSIEEKYKAKMNSLGKWVATNPSAPKDLPSYHISGLLSLSLSWGYVARSFLISKDDRARLQNFHNSILGKPWQPQIATINEATIDKLIEASPSYQKGELLEKPKALLMGVDVQQQIFYYMVTAVYESGRMSIVDYGRTISFEDLSILAQQQYRVKGGDETFGIYGAFIDAGYRTSDVYRFCRNSGMWFVPVFGRTKEQKMFVPIRRNDILFDNQYITIVHINDTIFSTNVLLNGLRSGGDESIWFPSNSCKMLKEQLTAVTIQEKKDAKGFIQRELVSKTENHWFDCLKLNLAMHYMIRPDLETEEVTPMPTVQAEAQEESMSVNSW